MNILCKILFPGGQCGKITLSTAFRLVFDASLSTASGSSLNDILPQGRSNTNKVVEVPVCWFTHRNAFHTDVQKTMQLFNNIG